MIDLAYRVGTEDIHWARVQVCLIRGEAKKLNEVYIYLEVE